LNQLGIIRELSKLIKKFHKQLKLVSNAMNVEWTMEFCVKNISTGVQIVKIRRLNLIITAIIVLIKIAYSQNVINFNTEIIKRNIEFNICSFNFL
jgi:hypothetical protein